jgi:hypothetical protein
MSKLLVEIEKLEEAIKSRNPKARLKWRNDYHKALETAQTPQDYEIIQNMSVGEFYEYVMHLERARSKSKQSIPEKPPTGSKVEIWLDYYHAMQRAKMRYSFADLSMDSDYDEKYLIRKNSEYKAAGKNITPK